MSKIPDTKKTKYNNNDPFRWVDSQWEKYMVEQKEHKAQIKQLQDDLVTCNKHFQKQRQQLENLVAIVPSKLLTEASKNIYIYESPDKGKTIYRREFGDYDSPRVQVDCDGNPYPEQLNLFK